MLAVSYQDNVNVIHQRRQTELMEKQVALALETNRLLRLLLRQEGVDVPEPETSTAEGPTAPQSDSRAARFFRALGE